MSQIVPQVPGAKMLLLSEIMGFVAAAVRAYRLVETLPDDVIVPECVS